MLAPGNDSRRLALPADAEHWHEIPEKAAEGYKRLHFFYKLLYSIKLVLVDWRQGCVEQGPQNGQTDFENANLDCEINYLTEL